MALPFLGPLVPLVPVIKMLALGSVKFIGVGIGALIAPVLTANFLVGLSAGTPLKYARFRQRKGQFSDADLKLIEDANNLVAESISNEENHLSRSDAREFLKEVLLSTAASMKESIVSLPSRIAQFSRQLVELCKKPFSS